ncbi:MAG: hypothetical protein IBJ10_03805 [Phycisphaerales bacterium]|nr:hypothetical protein [Phycisphaerales bacterium]
MFAIVDASARSRVAAESVMNRVSGMTRADTTSDSSWAAVRVSKLPVPPEMKRLPHLVSLRMFGSAAASVSRFGSCMTATCVYMNICISFSSPASTTSSAPRSAGDAWNTTVAVYLGANFSRRKNAATPRTTPRMPAPTSHQRYCLRRRTGSTIVLNEGMPGAGPGEGRT